MNEPIAIYYRQPRIFDGVTANGQTFTDYFFVYFPVDSNSAGNFFVEHVAKFNSDECEAVKDKSACATLKSHY